MTQIQTTSGKFIERKERRIYLADRCPIHGIRYQSFSKRKLKMGCRKCRSQYVDPNQVPMFEQDGKCQYCNGQNWNGAKWVGDHMVGCPNYKYE